MERDQLFLAAEEGDIATIETLLNAKYVNVNIREPQVIIMFVECLFKMYSCYISNHCYVF